MVRKAQLLLIPLIIFALSLALRLSLVSQGPYNVDGLKLVIEALKTLETGRLGHMLGPGYPLAVLSAAGTIALGKAVGLTDPVFAVNLMNVIISAAAVLAMYALAAQLSGQTAAVLASLLFSICPLFFGISVYGKSQPLEMLAVLGGFACLAVFKKRGGERYFWGAALFFGAAAANRLHEILLVFPAVTFWLCQNHSGPGPLQRGRWRRVGLFWMVVATAAAAAHLPYLWQDASGEYRRQIDDWLGMGLRGKLILGYSPRLWLGAGYLAEALTWGGLIMAAAGALRFARRDRGVLITLGLWFLVPYVFYSNSYMSVTSRYFVFIVPPLLLAAADMFAHMFTKGRALKLANIAIVVMMAMVMWARIYPPVSVRHRHAYLPDFARWTATQAGPGARIIASDEGLFFEYYTDLKLVSRPFSQQGVTPEELERFRTDLNALLAQNIPVYIHSVSLFSYDPGGIFAGFVRQNYDLAWVGVHPYEDWHRGEMVSAVFPNHLYRIHPKE